MLHRLLKAWAAPEDENTQDLIPPTASPPRRRKLAAAAAAAPAEGEAAVAPAVPLKARRRAAPGDNSRLDMYRDKPWYATDKDARGQWTFRTDAELHWDGDRLKSRWAGRQAFGSARALQRDVQPWVFPDDIPSADDPLLELPAGVGAWFPDQVAAAVMVNVASRIIYVKMGMGKTLMAALAARLHLRRERRGGVPGRVWLVGPKFTLKGTQAEFAKVLTADEMARVVFCTPNAFTAEFYGLVLDLPGDGNEQMAVYAREHLSDALLLVDEAHKVANTVPTFAKRGDEDAKRLTKGFTSAVVHEAARLVHQWGGRVCLFTGTVFQNQMSDLTTLAKAVRADNATVTKAAASATLAVEKQQLSACTDEEGVERMMDLLNHRMFMVDWTMRARVGYPEQVHTETRVQLDEAADQNLAAMFRQYMLQKAAQGNSARDSFYTLSTAAANAFKASSGDGATAADASEDPVRVNAVVDYVTGHVPRFRRVLVFGQRIQGLVVPIAEKFKSLEGVDARWVSGQASQAQRAENVRWFQEDAESEEEEVRVLVLGPSGSVGLNLDRADAVVVADGTFSHEEVLQMYARAIRPLRDPAQAKTVYTTQITLAGHAYTTSDQYMKKITEAKSMAGEKLNDWLRRTAYTPPRNDDNPDRHGALANVLGQMRAAATVPDAPTEDQQRSIDARGAFTTTAAALLHLRGHPGVEGTVNRVLDQGILSPQPDYDAMVQLRKDVLASLTGLFGEHDRHTTVARAAAVKLCGDIVPAMLRGRGVDPGYVF
jgi:hypothetical protein